MTGNIQSTDETSQHGDAVAIALESVEFSWSKEEGKVDLSISHLEVARGEKMFITGPSGSGKSTLLTLLSGVSVPGEGKVTILDQLVSGMAAAARDRFRADHVGYIFQMFNLIPYLSVIDNVTLPLRYSDQRSGRVSDPKSEARRLLDHLGLSDYLDRKVTDLSVGQQQRVAAARALIGSPEIILADEPTSSLDLKNSETFVELLFEECRRAKATLVFVSHDERLAGEFDRTIAIGSDGHAETGKLEE